jgi:hypothetical protein
MSTFTYPSSRELREIAQEKMPRLIQDRLGFQLFPMTEADAYLVSWEQKDNYAGLQQLRGLNGEPSRVKHVGAKRYDIQPGVYGEFKFIDELQLTMRRQWGTFGTPIDISDLVMEAQDHLLERRLDRIELIIWTLLATGTFSVALPYGAGIAHTDTYTLQTYAAGVAWSTFATATPILDFRTVRLLGRGKGVTFDANARAYMNSGTANNLLQNANANDLFGRRHTGLQTLNNMKDINALLMNDNLPQIVEYDQGYLDDNGTFQLYIPNNKVIVVGARPAGQLIGEYKFTRNVNNPDMSPGAYMAVIDRGAEGSGRQVPRTIEVHDGHNGGPAIYYPGSIVVMTV